eukprot:g58700.t1
MVREVGEFFSCDSNMLIYNYEHLIKRYGLTDTNQWLVLVTQLKPWLVAPSRCGQDLAPNCHTQERRY